jgi:hypothetical protein
MKNLNIAHNLTLPLDAVTQTFAILAKRGVGKTHTGSVMAEEMLKVGQPIVVYDPTGAWWGLKSSADGKRPGYPVVIFGGEHADVPLEESAGATIASVIVEKRIPAILDCGLMRKGSRIRFMTDFCETLYHKNREALHFFVDEAQTIAPQNLKAMPEAARLLGAMEDIVLQGRRRGLGMTIISPRPAVVNTNLRSACEVIIAMQIVAPHDRKAIQEWVDLHGDDADRAKEMMESLSSLKRGEAWVWSPSWLEIFQRVKFRVRETFDSSATPTVGQTIVTPKQVAEIDLDALGAEIKQTVQRVKENDPKELKRRIAELEKAAKAPAPTAKPERVEVPVVTEAQVKRVETIIERLEAQGTKHIEAGEKLYAEAKEFRASLAKAVVPLASVRQPMMPRQQTTRPPPTVRREVKPRESSGDGSLPKGERAVLIAAAQYEDGVDREQLSILTGYKRSSRDTYLQRLRERGFIDQRGDTLTATAEGVAALGDFEPLPTGDELRAYWLARLPEGERRVLEVLIERHPDPVPREVIDEETGYKRSSRDTYLQRLSARKIVRSVGRGEVSVSDELFG